MKLIKKYLKKYGIIKYGKYGIIKTSGSHPVQTGCIIINYYKTSGSHPVQTGCIIINYYKTSGSHPVQTGCIIIIIIANLLYIITSILIWWFR